MAGSVVTPDLEMMRKVPAVQQPHQLVPLPGTQAAAGIKDLRIALLPPPQVAGFPLQQLYRSAGTQI